MDRHNITEDISVRDASERLTGAFSKVLLGEIIERDKISKVRRGTVKNDIFSLFRMQSLKQLSDLSIVTVNSLYNRLLIRNSSMIKKLWDIFMELILAYNVVTTLFFLAYQTPSGAFQIVDSIHWIFFIVDIGLTLFTEQISEKGLPITDFKTIFILYLKGYLILDVLAIIPFQFGGNAYYEYYFRMVRLFKLPGVLNLTDGTGISFLLTYFSFGKREKNGKVTYTYKAKIIASLIKLFITIIFIVYFLGCFFFWFQALVNNYKYSDGATNINEGNFATNYMKPGMSIADIALRSSYYMLTTIATIGYGDFQPQNIYEMSFIMLVMLFGVTLFAYIMGNFNNAITFYNEANSGVDYLGSMNTWLDSLERLHGKIPKDLRNKITAHFTFYYSSDRLKSLAKRCWEAETPDDLISVTQEYVSSLPEDIYLKILDSLFSDFIYHFNFYLGESNLKYAIIPHLQPRRFLKGDLIFQSNKHVKEVLFILSGDVSIGIDIHGNHEILLFLENGRTVIGDYPVITRLKNKFDYYAQTTVVAYEIDAEALLKILDNFYKAEKNNILAISAKREANVKRLLNDHLLKANFEHSMMTEINKKYNTVLPKKNNTVVNYSEEAVEADTAEIKEKTLSVEDSLRKARNLVESVGLLREQKINALKKADLLV